MNELTTVIESLFNRCNKHYQPLDENDVLYYEKTRTVQNDQYQRPQQIAYCPTRTTDFIAYWQQETVRRPPYNDTVNLLLAKTVQTQPVTRSETASQDLQSLDTTIEATVDNIIQRDRQVLHQNKIEGIESHHSYHIHPLPTGQQIPNQMEPNHGRINYTDNTNDTRRTTTTHNRFNIPQQTTDCNAINAEHIL